MPNDHEVDEAAATLARFVDKFSGLRLFSTGARVVTYDQPLYNVKGSTPDPKIDGKAWKRLLQNHGISGDCFADTPDAPSTSSHADFSVGGHVTPNSDGMVPVGSTCFLMPLCYWHNGKANDGKPFSHAEIRMLELIGYMQGEPAATYLARTSGIADYALVFIGAEGLSYRGIPGSPGAFLANNMAKLSVHPDVFVMLRKEHGAEEESFTIENARVPTVAPQIP